MSKLRIGILIGPKGRGSNMEAIIDACQARQIDGVVAVVVSPKPNIATELATRKGVAVCVVDPAVEGYPHRLLDALGGCNTLCLAGYLRLLPSEVLGAFPSRVLNVHPALLPSFGGQGMYGLRVHDAVIESGAKESGATIHLVTEQYDEGRILVQRRCPVLPDDTSETLADRVLIEEHLAYVEALKQLA